MDKITFHQLLASKGMTTIYDYNDDTEDHLLSQSYCLSRDSSGQYDVRTSVSYDADDDLRVTFTKYDIIFNLGPLSDFVRNLVDGDHQFKTQTWR